MRNWKTKSVAGYPMVGMVVSTYRQPFGLFALKGCLLGQTYKNFGALAVHDGPDTSNTRELWAVGDTRFQFVETTCRENQFGHPGRTFGFDRFLDRPGGPPDFLCTTNGDNLYAPVYFEALLSALVRDKADLAFCNMVHSHDRKGKTYQPMATKMARGHIDAGCWIARSELVKGLTWGTGFAADWEFVLQMLSRKPKVVKVDHYLFYHN